MDPQDLPGLWFLNIELCLGCEYSPLFSMDLGMVQPFQCEMEMEREQLFVIG